MRPDHAVCPPNGGQEWINFAIQRQKRAALSEPPSLFLSVMKRLI